MRRSGSRRSRASSARSTAVTVRPGRSAQDHRSQMRAPVGAGDVSGHDPDGAADDGLIASTECGRPQNPTQRWQLMWPGWHRVTGSDEASWRKGTCMDNLETLLYEEKEGVAVVTLNRPEVHNAFNLAMQEELRQVWRSLRTNEDVRAVVLTGAGEKAFCTGIDRAEAIQEGYLEKRRDQIGRASW